MQRLTLAQQIAQLENTAPTDFDPEDIYDGNPDGHEIQANDDDVEMNSPDLNTGREHYVDVGPSELRKLRDSIADPKYEGVKMSRRQLHTMNESESESEELHSSDVSAKNDQSDQAQSINGDSPSSESEEEEQEDDDEARFSMPNGTEEAALTHELSMNQQDDTSQDQEAYISSLQRTRAADVLKGKAVSRQLAIWDSLVDARIRLQKSVTAANNLPHPAKIEPYVSTSAGRAAARQLVAEALLLSDEIFELRHTLLTQAGSVQSPRKKQRIDFSQEDLNLEQLVGESTAEMVAFDARTHAETLATIQKWSAKVHAVAPSALISSSRVAFKTGPAYVRTAAELIDEALRDQSKAVKATWGKVDRGSRLGESDQGGREEEDGEGDEEAFDDRDFYQAMLRDVIESKGGKDVAPNLYANSRKQKGKKVIDTKASKGRKIRYEPHEKLENFMVPIPVRGAWHDEQIDELFASLLGKGFEDVGPASITNGLEAPTRDGDALQELKIFG